MKEQSVLKINRGLGLEFDNTLRNRQSKVTQIEFSTKLRKTRRENGYEWWICNNFGQATCNEEGVKKDQQLHWLQEKMIVLSTDGRKWRVGY